jgi:predicted benzoate:H+ symporter BenE
MIQLYFLSIVCNGLAGYVLFAGSDSKIREKTNFSINNTTFYLVLGIISIVTGVLKLLSPTLDGIPILGDLLPAAAGVIAGIMLIFGIYRQDTSEKSGELDRFGTSLLAFRKPIGLALMAVALVHFLFPQALFL